jgi:methylenetetrahydrofolate dehydrogenase (NADP+)/methenyltetrahydrofolate cyclohydrolase
MSAVLIDGRSAAAELSADVRAKAEASSKRGVSPRLAVSLVGDDPASVAYVRGLQKAADRTAVTLQVEEFSATISQRALEDALDALASDSYVSALVLPQPLPPTFDLAALVRHIPPGKDVDASNPLSLAALALGTPAFVPATPAAIMHLLDRSPHKDIGGKRALVVGRSRVVGLPVALLLLRANATVTIAHSKTADLARHAREAEILVAAAGVARLIDGAMLSPGVTVIDAGTNVEGSTIVGDVDFASASMVAGAITPVPGGVGPLTNVMLMKNVVTAAAHGAA